MRDIQGRSPITGNDITMRPGKTWNSLLLVCPTTAVTPKPRCTALSLSI